MDFGGGMERQIISDFFHKLAHTFDGKATRYTSFSDGSCEFFIPSTEANSDLLANLVNDYFGQLDTKTNLEKLRKGECPSLPIVFSDPEVNLFTMFIIEGNTELYRISVKLLPLDVVEAALSVFDGNSNCEDDFEFIPACDKSVTWH